MTFIQLAGPVSAATAVNVVLLGLAWKATQQEKRLDRAPWYWEVGLVAYIAACGLILHLLKDQTISGSAEIFGVALLAETFGVVALSAPLHAIHRQDRQPIGQRVFEIGAGLFLLGLVIATLFA